VDEAADGCGADAAADHFGDVVEVSDVAAKSCPDVLGRKAFGL
jgi:hypothetical protein